MTKLLNAAQVAAAVRFHQTRPELAASIPKDFPGRAAGYATAEFAQAVAEFQAAHGLFVDGKAGAQETIPALRNAYLPQPSGASDVLVFAGEEHTIPGVRIVNTRSPEGYDFSRYPGHVHDGVLPSPPALVIHDSITRTTDACFKVLLTRKDAKTGKNMGLGTGLMLSPSGTLYQCVPDLNRVTWHAGSGWNTQAIGLDVIALLDPSLAPRAPNRRPPTSWAPQGYLDYTPEQIVVLPKVIRGICDARGIPFDCPRDHPNGSPACRGANRALVLDPKTYRGVVAHGQLSTSRWDGNRALEIVFGRAL